jgi:fluoroacetyl-CoA thioesterase
MAKPVPIGTRAKVQRVVEFKHTLKAVHDPLPPVLSTPSMIGLMEYACFEATLDFCEGDEITVGTHINVSHRAPTGVGSLVVAEAVLEKIDGRFHIFRVTAKHNGLLLGEGYVHRAFVSVGKFMQKQGQGKS